MRKSVQRVLEFRLRSTPSAYRVQIDLENIEELFSLAAAVDDSLTGNIRIAVAATLDYCAAINSVPKTRFNIERGGFDIPEGLKTKGISPSGLENTDQFETTTYNVIVAGLLGYLDVRRRQATNAFVSFNYDLLVEDALTSLGTPFSYGFSSRSVTEDRSTQSMSLARDAELQVLKLHGSTNWAFPGHQGGKLTIFGSYDEVRTAGYAPELVPPTWRKSFDGPLVHVWREALAQISRATRLVIIGFSAPSTDLHFKYLLAAGLRENISLREVVFVNTDARGIERRAAELFGDLSRRPTVRIVATEAKNFVGQARAETNISSVGRTIHRSIQSVYHNY